MDLGYRCSLLYKALFEQEEEKKKEKQTKEEFEAELFKAHGKAIEKFTEMRLRVEFKTAYEIFHAKRGSRSVFIDVDGDCEVWRDEG